jgi:hypothetical protein
LALPPCNDSFIRKHGVNYEEVGKESMEVISYAKSNGEHDDSVSFYNITVGPQIGGARARPKMGIYRVRKTCRLIRLTSTCLLKSTQKGMSSPVVTIWVRN